MSFQTKTRILLFLQKFKKDDFFKSQLATPAKKAYIFLAADYGNLGDVAITYAQTNFLKNNLPDFEIVDVPISKTLIGISEIKKTIKKDDIVTTVGGGNLGDLYDQIEFYRQLVVKQFPNNNVISFPQTIDFSETDEGKKALQIAQNCYSKHKNLTFVARETISFAKMKSVFAKNKVVLSPDIVMSCNEIEPSYARKGVVMCLREDAEKLLTSKQQTILLQLVNSNFDSKTTYDTHINKNQLTLEERGVELQKIWTAFKKAELVITDRLHGMIFCYITNTPCLVFQNNNHKVKGCYEWIKDKSNIKLIQDFSENEIATLLKDKFYINKKHELIETEFDLLKQNVKK